MSIDRQSLSVKLVTVVGAMFVAMAGLIVVISYISLSKTEQRITSEVGAEINKQIQDSVTAKGARYASEIAKLIENAYMLPVVVGGQITASIEGAEDKRLSRDQVQALVEATLKNGSTSSMYAQFEANKFDGQSAQYTSGYSHSVEGHGSFEVYFVREPDGSIAQEPVDDPEEKFDTTKNEYGIRAAEWFLCAKEQRKPCIVNPYNYEIRPGYEELMTSLTYPVIANGEFRGVVGTDLNLPILQRFADELKASLYDGHAKVFVVSQDGFLAAATDNLEKLSRPFSEVFSQADTSKKILGQSGSADTFEYDGDIYVTRPIVLSTPKTNWQLVVAVNADAALAPITHVKDVIAGDIRSMLTTLLVLSTLATAVALVLVWWFTGSIVKPVQRVADKMTELAGQGGDLTQRIDEHSHSELVKLSEAFNMFREKVRELLDQAKLSGQHVISGSQENRQRTQKTNRQIQLQLNEIDSVVTAITQMSETAREVARGASEAANNADAANDAVKQTEREVSESADVVASLSDEMLSASNAVKAVSDRSQDIKKILEVIGAIAEQTNLLALNAAIEAARAGDQGRGFAVVADEVRTLAQRTGESTKEIARVIEALQGEVNATVAITERSANRVGEAASRSRQAFEKMRETVRQIDEISQRVMQMATAAEQQSQVSEELNRNMVVIGDASTEVAHLSQQSEHSSEAIFNEIQKLDELLSKLKTH